MSETCEWTYDDGYNAWETDCGHAFELNDGAPSDNDMKFCCYCGLPLDEQHPDEEE